MRAAFLGAGGLLAAVFFFIAVVTSLALDTRGVEQRLIDEAVRLASGDGRRPVHVDRPVPGAFGEALIPHLDDLSEAAEAFLTLSEEDKDAWHEVRQGDRPLGDLPARALHIVDRWRNAAHGAVRASRAETARPIVGLRPLEDPAAPFQQDGNAWMRIAGRIVSTDIRLMSDDGRTDEAVALCMDGLATRRDLAHDQDFLLLLMGVVLQQTIYRSCAEAFSQADPFLATRGIDQIERIRDAIGPLSRTVETFNVIGELIAFGAYLHPSTLDALPEGARAIAEGAEHYDVPRVLGRLFVPLSWNRTARRSAALPAIFDLPRDARERALAEFEEEMARSWHPFDASPPDLGRFADRHLQALGQLEVLRIVLAAASYTSTRGDWPESVQDLVDAGLLEAIPEHPLSQTPLEIVPVGHGVWIPGPPPEGGDETDLLEASRVFLHAARTARSDPTPPRVPVREGAGLEP